MPMPSQRTSAHDFWDAHVWPALDAWSGDPTDLRLALSAVLPLYHTADHVWHSYASVDPAKVLGTSSPSQYRSILAQLHPEFAIVRDVAEAHKHCSLDRLTRVVTNAAQTQPGSLGYGEGGYGTGPFGGGPSLIVELDDGSRVHLSAFVGYVCSMWEDLLA